MVLRWNVARSDKGKHDKFVNLWIGPYKIKDIQDNNTFVLQNHDGDERGPPVNGRFLKHF